MFENLLTINDGFSESSPFKYHHKLFWLLYEFKKKNFHVYRGTDWSNLAAGLAAGARTAAYSCNAARDINTDNLELRTSLTHVLDREVGKMYNFEPHKLILNFFFLRFFLFSLPFAG